MLQDNLKYNEKVKSNTGFLYELKYKLPEFFTADKFDEEGNLVEEGKFDLEKFQRALKEKNINEISSGYQLDFIGKDYAKKQAGESATTVIVPDNEHNNLKVNKNSKNLFFTGDNLDVLRHLQNNYSNTIDMVYIDPPYNTGSDGFIYPDSFEYSDQSLKDMFGMSDDELARLKSIQGKATHSAWLTFMYPRLWLAKRLLSEKGVIFISIDDNEVMNLKLLCDEIFGEGNYIDTLHWKRKKQPSFLAKHTAKVMEYILVYSKNENSVGKLSIENISDKTKKVVNLTNNVSVRHFNKGVRVKIGNDGVIKKGIYTVKSMQVEYLADVVYKDGITINEVDVKAQFSVSQELIDRFINEDLLFITVNYGLRRDVSVEEQEKEKAITDLLLDWGDNQDSEKEQQEILDGKYFDYTKPTKLLYNLIKSNTSKDNLILDFFSGSATTAHATMQLNAEDGGNRKYIMVQIAEKTYSLNDDGTKVPNKGSKAAFNTGYMSIDEISRERIKRASKKIREESGLTLPENFDCGFKHYQVVLPEQPTLDDLESFDVESGLFKNSIGQLVQLPENGFDDMIQPFSSEALKLGGNANGVDTIITTWLVSDGYKMDIEVESIDLDGYHASYIDGSRVYLIYSGWGSNQTKALLNLIGTNQLNVQTLVLYGYSFNLESIRELEIGLKQLNSKVNLLKRY